MPGDENQEEALSPQYVTLFLKVLYILLVFTRRDLFADISLIFYSK